MKNKLTNILASLLLLLAISGCATRTYYTPTYTPAPSQEVAVDESPDPSFNQNLVVTLAVYPAGVPYGMVFYNRYYVGCDCIITVYNFNGGWYNAYAPGVVLYTGGWVFGVPSGRAWGGWHHNGGAWHGNHVGYVPPRGNFVQHNNVTPTAPVHNNNVTPVAPRPAAPAATPYRCKWNPALKKCI